MPKTRAIGFTLTELLISLAILGVIATFTIPKILMAQQDAKYNAIAKEGVAIVTGAYQQYLLANGSAPTTFGIQDLTPYINYTTTDATSTIDSHYTSGSIACNNNAGLCLRLHNGAALKYWGADSFASSSSTAAVPFFIDPDGIVTTGTTNGPGKSVQFWLVRTGQITDVGSIPATHFTYSANSSVSAVPSRVPPWFSW